MDWKPAAGILLLPILALAIWYALGFPTNERAAEPTPFSQEGNLIQNNPGLEPDTWYLAYDAPGISNTVKLRFDGTSRCDGKLFTPCNISFQQGERVQIEGRLIGDTVIVRHLEYIVTSPETGVRILLYFYNPALDQGPGGAQCSRAGLVPVARVIPRTNTPIQDAVKLLLRGEISDEERAQGITSEYPLPNLALDAASLEGGVLTLTFSDPQNKTVGGSCRVAVLWHQIEATAKQFAQVEAVRFLPEELFQP